MVKQAEGWLQEQEAILLGDDLFSHQPFCEMVVEAELAFILVCKPTSHKLLYQWIEGMEEGGTLNEIVQRKWNGRHGEIWRLLGRPYTRCGHGPSRRFSMHQRS